MALTPQNNDAFFREVDEDLRRDQMVGAAKRYGRWIAVGVVLFLAVLAGALWWRAHLAAQAAADSETLSPVLATMEEGRLPADSAPLAEIAKSPRAGYAAAGRLALADIAAQKGDADGAAKQFLGIAGDGALPQPVRDLALVRATALQFDSLAPEKVIDRLKGLAIPGNAWFGSAGEMTALAWYKMGRTDKAGPLFASLARDAQIPNGVRSRAAGLATLLGQTITPPASAPAPKERR